MLNRKVKWEEEGTSGLGEAAPASLRDLMPAKRAKTDDAGGSLDA